jgi:multiple sugar transport system substrate-binding protein
MQNHRRLLLIVTLTLMAAFMSFSLVGAQEEVVTLDFVNWIGAEEATSDDLAAMIAAFEAANPNIRINSQPTPFNQSLETLLTRSLGGDSPDVSMAHVTWVAPLAEAGVLASLNDLLPNQDDYLTGMLDSQTIDDTLVAVPWASSPVVMYANMELLAEAGYDAPPTTWDEMIEMAYTVKDLGPGADGGQRYGLGISSGQIAGAGYFLLPFIWYHGGEFQAEDGSIVLDSPETVAAFTEIQALFDDGVTPEGVEIRDLRELFAQGRLAFQWDIESMVGTFAALSPRGVDFRDAYEIVLIPGASPEEPAPTISIFHTLVIYEDTPYKEQAAAFIDFLTGPEGLAVYNEYGGNKLAVRTSSAAIDFYDQPENAFLEVFLQAIEGPARSLPAKSSAFLEAMVSIATANQRVGLNAEDAAVVVADLQAAVARLYDR